jgi:hypothetical protein
MAECFGQANGNIERSIVILQNGVYQTYYHRKGWIVYGCYK